MSNCPASELLKQRRIPAFVPPNDAAEAICKLPAKIPSMAASDIQSTYNFRPDEINESIAPLYYTVSQEPVSSDAAGADDCVETTDVSSDSFTWVDWLTPITSIEGDRNWILAGELLNCTDNGDLSNSTTFKRPALPITQFGSVLPAPITAPISVASALGGNGGGGGGGGQPVQGDPPLIEIKNNNIIIHPTYIKIILFDSIASTFYIGFKHNTTDQFARNTAVSIDNIGFDITDTEDGEYTIYAYYSNAYPTIPTVDAEKQQISFIMAQGSNVHQLINALGCYIIPLCDITVNKNKLYNVRIKCSRINEIIAGDISSNGNLSQYWWMGAFVKLTNVDEPLTNTSIEFQLDTIYTHVGAYYLQTDANSDYRLIDNDNELTIDGTSIINNNCYIYLQIDKSTNGSPYYYTQTASSAEPSTLIGGIMLGRLYNNGSSLRLFRSIVGGRPFISVPLYGFKISIDMLDINNPSAGIKINVAAGTAVLAGDEDYSLSEYNYNVKSKSMELPAGSLSETKTYYVYLIFNAAGESSDGTEAVDALPVGDICYTYISDNGNLDGSYAFSGNVRKIGDVRVEPDDTVQYGYDVSITQRLSGDIKIGPSYMGPFCFLPATVRTLASQKVRYIVNPRGGYKAAAAAPTVNRLTEIFITSSIKSVIPTVAPIFITTDGFSLYFFAPVVADDGGSFTEQCSVSLLSNSSEDLPDGVVRPTDYDGTVSINIRYTGGIVDIPWLNAANISIEQVLMAAGVL